MVIRNTAYLLEHGAGVGGVDNSLKGNVANDDGIKVWVRREAGEGCAAVFGTT